MGKLFTSFLLVGAEVRTFQTRLLEVVKEHAVQKQYLCLSVFCKLQEFYWYSPQSKLTINCRYMLNVLLGVFCCEFGSLDIIVFNFLSCLQSLFVCPNEKASQRELILNTQVLRQEVRNSAVGAALGTIFTRQLLGKNLVKRQRLHDQNTYFMQTFCNFPTDNTCAVFN